MYCYCCDFCAYKDDCKCLVICDSVYLDCEHCTIIDNCFFPEDEIEQTSSSQNR